MAIDPQPTSPGPGPDPGDQATAWLSPDDRATVGLTKGGGGSPSETPPEVPGYAIERTLGRGGMGVVYLAKDLKLGRPVALKRVIFHDPELSRRLVQEARSQARIEHPHVCKVYEAGEVDGVPYVAMQFIEGRPLDEAARDLSVEARVRLMAEVAEAVHAAHRQGLIHRDLKPANILVATGEDGQPWPYVMDFGLAQDQTSSRLTQVGAVMGTPAYMSPEQARGDVHALDRRTDVYALGATLYEALTGNPPFEGRSGADTLLRVIQEEPTPLRKCSPSLPEDLEVIAHKCLEKEPARRYDSAKALAEDLRAWLDGDPIRARRTGLAGRLLKKARKHKLAVGLGAVAVAGVLVGAGALWRSRSQIQEASELSRQFGAEFAQAEAILRYGHLMPVHPMTREEGKVLDLQRQIEQRIQGLRGLPLAAGRMALGRVLLLQGKAGPARKALEAARDAGLKDAQLNLALAQAYHADWMDRTGDAVVSLTGDELAAAQKRLLATLIDPAEALLAGQEAPLMRFRLALARRQEAEAATWKARALEAEPWAYEVHAFEAMTFRNQTLADLGAGRFAEALAGLERAWDCLERARALAPSDPFLAKLGYRLSSLANEVSYRRAQPPEPRWVARGEASLALLERLSPGSAEARFLKAKWDMERLMVKNDQAPVAEVEWEAPRRTLSELAASPSPFQLEAAFMVATLRMLEIEGRSVRHEDTGPLVAAMIPELEQALKDAPEHPDLLNRLGMAHHRQAVLDLGRGQDCLPSLARAVDLFHRVLKRNPDQLEAELNLVTALSAQGTIARSRGGDPSAALREAHDLLEQIRKRIGEDVSVQRNQGVILSQQASWAMTLGMDPSRELEEARALAKSLLGTPAPLIQDGAKGLLNGLDLMTLQWEWSQGRLDAAGFARLKREMAALVSHPALGNARVDDADFLVGSARMSWERGMPFEADLRAAEALLGPLGDDPDALGLRLRIALQRMEAGSAAERTAARASALRLGEAYARIRFGETLPGKARARVAWLDLRDGRAGAEVMEVLSAAAKEDPYDADLRLLEADAARRLAQRLPAEPRWKAAMRTALDQAQSIRKRSLDQEWMGALVAQDAARIADLKARHPWLARRWPES